ncbi:uncharacterized protein [Primulina huaijiensis]|uniref:uncharacterized protein isoform X2 n=1 Tax=Primulina huaijiensis TaxID=1492673 RepID=UPI003CC72DC3
MDNKRRQILLLVLLHQIMFRSFVMLCLLTLQYKKLVAKRRRLESRAPTSYNMTRRINAQMSHLYRIIEIGDVQCVVNLRMNRNAFAHLCYLLTTVGGLVESRYVRIQEKVAMFLSILAHHKKNRITGHDFMRSGHTISIHFHEVLRSVLKLHPILLAKPIPVDDNCTNETWKWFKGCLGALEGTYVSVHVPTSEKPKYRTRKGCYYLCDNGYANLEGFLTPYRRVRYHRDAWGNRSTGPQNYKELFNWRHALARNVIERAFGLLKKRWAILRSPSFYPLEVQNKIILACILLHNFIRSQMPNDPIEEVEEETDSLIHENEDDFIESFESYEMWDIWRDNLAMSMYHN